MYIYIAEAIEMYRKMLNDSDIKSTRSLKEGNSCLAYKDAEPRKYKWHGSTIKGNFNYGSFPTVNNIPANGDTRATACRHYTQYSHVVVTMRAHATYLQFVRKWNTHVQVVYNVANIESSCL